MADLRSAPAPPLRQDDHVRGEGDAPLLIMYADFTCPACAVLHERLRTAGDVRVVFRHFALKARHRRAPALAAAAEAAAAQGAFWAWHDATYAEPGRVDDPHLWARAQALGLDLDRFEADRRSEAALARVREDTRDALRAGAVATPTLYAHPPERAILARFGY